MISYNNEEEYYLDIVDWGKQWIAEYSSVAVQLEPDGHLKGIKEGLNFGDELATLVNVSFTKKEKQEYDDFIKQMLLNMDQIHQRGCNKVAMEHLYQLYHFSDFEWFMIIMSFLVEFEQQFGHVFSLLQDDKDRKEPSIALCIQMFTLDEQKKYEYQRQVIKRWDVLSNVFAYRIRSELGELRQSIFSLPLILDDRIIRFLFRQRENLYFKEVLNLHLPYREHRHLLIRAEQVKKIDKIFNNVKGGLVYISGMKGIGKKFLVSHYCRQADKRHLLVNVPRLVSELSTNRQTVKRLIREAHLQQDAVLCFDDISLKESNQIKLIELIVDELDEKAAAPIFLSSEKWDMNLNTKGIDCMEIDLNPVTVAERAVLWKGMLEGLQFEEAINFNQLADRYQLTPDAIALAVKELKKQKGTGTRELTEKELYQAAQNQIVHQLGNEAVRISVKYTMEDLVLPESQKQLLNNACNLVEYRHQVYTEWGFDSKMAYGKGVNMLFYGPPGTGKTMGAQAVADKLNMEIYRVDMSNVLSKYVGESEKKLGKIFEEGQKSQSILFFDEADALFGKRSEVKDSQDKYANASTAYLLQKIEEYQGVVILATNFLQNFDTAFSRRFQFIIEFPMPDISHRLKIWKRVFPEALPVQEDIDYEYLAEQFAFSGSQIKSVAVAAAFLAAGEQQKMSMWFILESIKWEMKKVGKNLISGDFGKYCSLMTTA